MKSDLLVFGEDWGAHPTSTQHLIHHLSQDRRVLWVNSIGLRRPKLSGRDMGRLWRKGKSLLSKKTSPDHIDPFGIVAPKAVPWPGNPLARWVNKQVLGRQIRGRLNDLGFEKPVIWTSLPTVVDVVDQFERSALIYYCGDDFAALDGVDHGPVSACEERLAHKADLILTVSEKLAEKFPKHKTVVIPHGVDFDLFSIPAPCPIECDTYRPIAGFYGSLAEWVNVDLMAETARKMAHWDFMFVGPISTDISAFEGLENIKLVEPQPHARLPGFVQNWEAALLPFKDNDQIRACNPLKLREYIASGTPVYTTRYPAMEAYQDVVTVFESSDDLCQALERVQPNPKQAARVVGESWRKRALDIDSLLGQWAMACGD